MTGRKLPIVRQAHSYLNQLCGDVFSLGVVGHTILQELPDMPHEVQVRALGWLRDSNDFGVTHCSEALVLWVLDGRHAHALALECADPVSVCASLKGTSSQKVRVQSRPWFSMAKSSRFSWWASVRRGFLTLHVALSPPRASLRAIVTGDRAMPLCFLARITVLVSGPVPVCLTSRKKMMLLSRGCF